MRKTTQKIIGENLKLLRTSHGMNQHQMAAIIGCSRALYAHYELGNRSQDTETLFSICTYFGIDICSLFEADHHNFLNIIANGINTSEQFREIANLYNKLSPYSRGRLAERALALYDEETDRNEKKQARFAKPFK